VTSVTYRCSNCLDHTVARDFDVSHLSRTCDACGEHSRFVHDGVYEQYREFEESPPATLAWERLRQIEKFVVAEGIVRKGRTLDDFDVRSNGSDDSDDDGGADTGDGDNDVVDGDGDVDARDETTPRNDVD
jgi:hypothetical protein